MSHLEDWAAALVDSELPPADRDRALAHLAGCADCRADVDRQRQAKASLMPDGDAGLPSAALTARLLAIPQAASTDTPRTSRRGALVAPAPRRSRPWPARAAQPVPARRRRGRVAAGSLGVAAAVAVALVAAAETPTKVAPPVGTFVVEHTATTTQLPLQDPVAGVVLISAR